MDNLNNTLSVLRTNPYISATTSLFLVLYAGLAAPALPASIAGLFEHSVFKLMILVMVLVLLKGKNVTLALLVSIGFVVSMGTLSRYRVYTMANELSSLNQSKHKDQAYGPEGQPPAIPSDVAKWKLDKGTNKLTIHGYEYAGNDEPNHLPGGHGDMENNNNIDVAAPMHPDKFYKPEAPDAYNGSSFATIGEPNSQL